MSKEVRDLELVVEQLQQNVKFLLDVTNDLQGQLNNKVDKNSIISAIKSSPENAE